MPYHIFFKLTQKKETDINVCVCVYVHMRLTQPLFVYWHDNGYKLMKKFQSFWQQWQKTQMFHHPLAGINHSPAPPTVAASVEAVLIN